MDYWRLKLRSKLIFISTSDLYDYGIIDSKKMIKIDHEKARGMLVDWQLMFDCEQFQEFACNFMEMVGGRDHFDLDLLKNVCDYWINMHMR